MRAMVASWPSEIGLMTKCRFGTDLTRERNRGYEYLLYTEFPDHAHAPRVPGSPRPRAVPGLDRGARVHPARVRLPPRRRHRPRWPSLIGSPQVKLGRAPPWLRPIARLARSDRPGPARARLPPDLGRDRDLGVGARAGHGDAAEHLRRRGVSGGSTPLAFLLGGVACLALAFVVIGFTRRMASAGYAYTYASRSLGKEGAFVVGWLYFFGMVCFVPMTMSGVGYLAANLLGLNPTGGSCSSSSAWPCSWCCRWSGSRSPRAPS